MRIRQARHRWPVLCFILAAMGITAIALAAYGEVKFQQRISAIEGGFTGTLVSGCRFGQSVSPIGDIDGDNIGDFAVGSRYGDLSRGGVWILFMNPDETVRDQQKIDSDEGGFTGVLETYDYFGSAVTGLGDFDGDSVPDIAVGASGDDDGGGNQGAVWILFLNADGTVKSHQKISATEGGFAGALSAQDNFGSSVASLGLLDEDNVIDLVVGAYGNDELGMDQGALWILFLNADGTVKSYQKISSTEGNFPCCLDDFDWFGTSVDVFPDFDSDGVSDLVVGAERDGDGGTEYTGAIWLVSLDTNGSVKSVRKISATQGGFTGAITGTHFGSAVAALPDMDGDGVADVAAGALADSDGGDFGTGAVWILFLNADGTVKSYQKISASEGNLTGLAERDFFGTSICASNDLNGDRIADLAVGAPWHDDTEGLQRGEVYILQLDGFPAPLALVLHNNDLSWTEAVTTLGYDVIRGRVTDLREANGDFSVSVDTCLAHMITTTTTPCGAIPPTGEAYWYLVREVTASGNGSYNSASQGQIGDRDAGIAASGLDCPGQIALDLRN